MISEGFTIEQLEEKSLLPLSRREGEPDWFVDVDASGWEGDIADFLTFTAKKHNDGEDLSEILLFQRCQSSTKKGLKAKYFHISQFPLSKDKRGKATWGKSITEMFRLVARETANSFKERNLRVLRMYCNGNEDENIVCRWTNFQVDSLEHQGFVYNIWEQHHFKVVNRSSVQKEGLDPGDILRSTDFTVPSPRSRYAIEDMMRTIFLSPTAHKIVHNQWNNSDITNYENHVLPWALRNEYNWNEMINFLMGMGYAEFPSYQEWFDSLKLTEDDLKNN